MNNRDATKPASALAAAAADLAARRGRTQDDVLAELTAERDQLQEQLQVVRDTVHTMERELLRAPDGEAGFSMTVDVIDPHGAVERVTWRGKAAEHGEQVLAAHDAWLEQALAIGWRFPPPPVVASQAPAAGQCAPAEFHWKTQNGALAVERGELVLIVPDGAAEPAEVVCPLHAGRTFKRREKDGDSWLSHRHDKTYCRAKFETEVTK